MVISFWRTGVEENRKQYVLTKVHPILIIFLAEMGGQLKGKGLFHNYPSVKTFSPYKRCTYCSFFLWSEQFNSLLSWTLYNLKNIFYNIKSPLQLPKKREEFFQQPFSFCPLLTMVLHVIVWVLVWCTCQKCHVTVLGSCCCQGDQVYTFSRQFCLLLACRRQNFDSLT